MATASSQPLDAAGANQAFLAAAAALSQPGLVAAQANAPAQMPLDPTVLQNLLAAGGLASFLQAGGAAAGGGAGGAGGQ